jgi:hypothetical protein
MGNKKIRLGLLPALPVFKGEETVRRWEKTLEDVILEMSQARDKRDLLILYDVDELIGSFNASIKTIRDNMNNDIGDPCTLIPRGY